MQLGPGLRRGGARGAALTTLTRRRPPPLLAGLGVIALACALLLAIGWALGRWPVAVDRAILIGLRQWRGPGWLREAAQSVTAVGSPTVLTLVTVGAVALLLAARHRTAALAAVAAAISGGVAITVIKQTIARPRPTVVDHWTVVHDLSFPSGHSASSAVVYLTLAALAAQVVDGRALRRTIMAIAVLLVGMIGVSRVYLGVHWPSDVLAGWCLGTLWALGWWLATGAWRASLRRQ